MNDPAAAPPSRDGSAARDPRIFVDRLFFMPSRVPGAHQAGAAHGHRWCHLWCAPGDEERLHVFAARIGMRRDWFQDRAGFPHYDLTPEAREDAVTFGATEVSLKQWLRERKTRRPATDGDSSGT